MVTGKQANHVLGQRIAAWRCRACLSQREVAAHLFLHREAIAALEAGNRKLSFIEAVMLRDHLGLTLHELSTGRPPQPS